MNLKKIISGIIVITMLVVSSVNVFASENEIILSAVGDGSIIDETTGLEDEEILKIYRQYFDSKGNSVSEDTSTLETLDEFMQYAIDTGAIEDTPVQRAAIEKAIVRREFKTVASCGYALGYTTASGLLNHSLQDSPADLSFSSQTTYSSQILNAVECSKIVDSFKKEVTGKNYSGWTKSGSTTLNSTNDLHLAYNKVSYVASGQNVNGTWTLTITFRDTYDFENQAWKNAMTDNAALVILNNYGAYAQSIGAIVPYNVRIIVKTTFTE